MASSHSSCKGGSNANAATDSTVTVGTYAGFLNSVNPCANRVGWLSVANLTEDKGLRRGDALSLAVPTAALFG